jgi:hypothetical protein
MGVIYFVKGECSNCKKAILVATTETRPLCEDCCREMRALSVKGPYVMLKSRLARIRTNLGMLGKRTT